MLIKFASDLPFPDFEFSEYIQEALQTLFNDES